MISVQRYKDEHINDTKEELVVERNRLLHYIEEYEERFIFGDEKDDFKYKPSRYAIYKTHHLYLAAISELLFQKTWLKDKKRQLGNSKLSLFMKGEYIKE